MFGVTDARLVVHEQRRRIGDVVFGATIAALVVWGGVSMAQQISASVGFGEFAAAAGLGLVTFARVLVIVVVGTLIWAPIGVWIGMNPRITSVAQPIVQVLASFPANFLFPFVTLLLIRTHVPLDWGGIFLMALGSQWYILFNVIAGASAIPADLREAATGLRLGPLLTWKTLIIPAIFSAWVTGGITTAGGAWNASIVAEVVSYGDTTLRATGLGAYIAQATATGDMARTYVGVVVMSVFVVGLNRAVWRPLSRFAETRLRLG